MKRPSFLDSPFFVREVDNWHLKDGAPESVVKEFNEYMNNSDITNKPTPISPMWKGNKDD